MNVNFTLGSIISRSAGEQTARDLRDGGASGRSFDDALSAKPSRKSVPGGDRAERASGWKPEAQADAAEETLAVPLLLRAGNAIPDAGKLPADLEAEMMPRAPKAEGDDEGGTQADAASALAVLASYLAPPKQADERNANIRLPGADTAPEAEMAEADAKARAAAPADETKRSTAQLFDAPKVSAEAGAAAAQQQAQGPRGAGRNSSPTSDKTTGTTTPQEHRGEPDLADAAARKTQRTSETMAQPPQSRQDGSAGDRGASRQDPLAAKVTVLGATNSVAPVQQQAVSVGSTAAGLAASIDADPTWRPLAQEATAQQRPVPSLGSVNTLRIQLNPAELGMVTVKLVAAGPQLSIEVQVESAEAHRKLTTDSEAILKALRSLGYDVEKVAIQQAQPGSGAQQSGLGGRDQSMANHQAQGEGGARGRGEQSQGDRNNDGGRHAAPEPAQNRTGGGLYI